MIFVFSLGGYPGPYFHLQLKGNQLHCTVIPKGGETKEQTSLPLAVDKDWAAVLDYLSTRNWKGVYEQKDTVDGTQWALQVRTENFSLACSGSNAYPAGFKKFLRLLNALTAKEGIEIY